MRTWLVTLLFSILVSNVLEAHPGIGIVEDSKGNVYYTDLVHVWKISPEGEVTIAVKDVHTHELYIDSEDNLYGEHEWYEGEEIDKWGNYVWCLKNNGELIKTIPDVEGFLDNNTLVRDRKGSSYWSAKSGEGQIIKKTSAQGKQHTFSEHVFEDIRWMFYSEVNGALYVVDLLSVYEVKPSGKVKLLEEDLKKRNSLFNGVADRHYVYGMWDNTEGDLFIALYGGGKVLKIGTDMETAFLGKTGMGWSPCGGITARDGSTWIMEFSIRNRTRVRHVMADGTEEVFRGD